jgi:hypothetical protein
VDYSERLSDLENRVEQLQRAVSSAATESRDQLKRRVEQAQADTDRALKGARQDAAAATDRAEDSWARMKADAAARMTEVRTRIEKRGQKLDAKAAATDADWAEADAADAIDYAEWAVENAKYVILSAVDARAYADERAKVASA